MELLGKYIITLCNRLEQGEIGIDSVPIFNIGKCFKDRLIKLSIIENEISYSDIEIIFSTLYKIRKDNGSLREFCAYLKLAGKLINQLEMEQVWKLSHNKLQTIIGSSNDNIERFCKLNSDSNNAEIEEVLTFVRKSGELNVFNYPYVEKYKDLNVVIEYDEEIKLYYALHSEKKMYFCRSITSKEQAKWYYESICCEQDRNSPHYYFEEGYEVKEGDVVIDAGVAEGNFALAVIDKVSKIYLVECDKEWLEALHYTFASYGNKVIFVDKFLGEFDDVGSICIDSLINGEALNFIKMDVEGAEVASLKGGINTLCRQKEIKCLICSYHQKGDEEHITEILQKCNFQVETSKGYMYFKNDIQAIINGELRRGLVMGKK